MGFEIIFPLICVVFGLTIAGLAIGSHFLKEGYRRKIFDKKRVNYITTGWILTGITSFLLTAAIVYLFAKYGYSVLVFIAIFSPILVIIIFVVSLSAGIGSLSDGYSEIKKQKDNPEANSKKKIVTGWISLAITTIVVIAMIVLFIVLLNNLSHVSIGAM